MLAYDIAVRDWCDGAPAAGGHGWCFGLPPGIASDQWPLDPISGYPLMHGFTLSLPEDYRVHGPENVALSFFSTAPDHNDGGTVDGDPAIAPVILTPGETPPDDPALVPIWHHARAAHPRLHRMTDILDCSYAVILLTQAEFEGRPAAPPEPIASPLLARVPPPEWLAQGSAAAYDRFEGAAAPAAPGHLRHRPFGWTARANDPNAGKPPRELYGDAPHDEGYRPYHYWLDGKVEAANWREHVWAAGHAPQHIGGTMRPVQAVPDFSPYYIEFEESFGGYNFGGGNAQLDFRDMRFDWACG